MTNVSNFIPTLASQTVDNGSNIEFVPTLLLLTKAPEHPTAFTGFEFAKKFCEHYSESADEIPLSVFVYGDGVHLANRLRWLPSDQINVAKLWQQLILRYAIPAQVCVATALARGVVDNDNAVRHQLDGENLAQGFSLVGLGELAMALHDKAALPNFRLLQF